VIVDPKERQSGDLSRRDIAHAGTEEFTEATRRRIHSDERRPEASIEALRTADAEASW